MRIRSAIAVPTLTNCLQRAASGAWMALQGLYGPRAAHEQVLGVRLSILRGRVACKTDIFVAQKCQCRGYLKIPSFALHAASGCHALCQTLPQVRHQTQEFLP